MICEKRSIIKRISRKTPDKLGGTVIILWVLMDWLRLNCSFENTFRVPIGAVSINVYSMNPFLQHIKISYSNKVKFFLCGVILSEKL